jgi:hypothetical protein
MCELSGYVLASVRNRQTYLKNAKASTHLQQQCIENYRVVLNNTVHHMIEFSMQDDAFLLAEKFKELDTLVQLTLGFPDPIIKIKLYLGRFGEPFAKILFQAYHTKGQLKELMDQDQYCSEYLERFLNENGHGYLSWIQDLGYGRFEKASSTLWELSQKEVGLKQQSVCLALAKLAYLEAHSDIPADQVQETLGTFDVAMDLVVAQKVALEHYKQVLTENGFSDFEKSDKAVDAILKTSFGTINNYRIRKLLLKQTLVNLFEGKKAQVESLMDLFTFQQGNEQYVTVLELLLNGKMDFEDTFDYRIHLLWRYVWFSDDWQDIRTRSETISDESLLQVLKSTKAYQLYEWFCNYG